MATTNKKKSASAQPEPNPAVVSSGPTRLAPEKPRNVAAYEAAVVEFAAAVQEFAQGRFAEAGPQFEALAQRISEDEMILADRARSFASVCARRLAAPAEGSIDADVLYHRGVFAANAGRYDEAFGLLDKALAARPNDASILYARATIRGLQGNVDGAAGELKRAVAIDPHLRFQAASDPDFERVRDEAAFIDVIEPTGAGA